MARLQLFDWLVAELVGVGINVLVLGSATISSLGFKLGAMGLGSMRDQLLVPVVLGIAARVLALVDLLLGVSPVVLPAVAAGVEALVTEVALEWLLASVHSLVNLVVRFRVESLPADLLYSCYDK